MIPFIAFLMHNSAYWLTYSLGIYLHRKTIIKNMEKISTKFRIIPFGESKGKEIGRKTQGLYK